MKKVYQTVFRDGDQVGNCHAACLASLLEVPIELIPALAEAEDLNDPLSWWLRFDEGYFYRIFGAV